MAKGQKDRVTVNQFDIALTEEIQHARGMHVQTNMVSNAAMFALMLRKRLYGEVKMVAAASAVVTRLMEDAKVERAEYELQQREAARRAERKIVLPGEPRFNPHGN